MLERRKEIRAEIHDIATDVEKLEGRLLELTARVAQEGYLPLFPELLPAAGKLDLAREALWRRKELDSGGRIEQHEPPPIPPGDDMAPPHRRPRGRRP